MGLLDDAIREHLELKRARGADPDEVARQENEALGAARRAEFARPEGGEGPADTGEPDAPAPAAETPAAPFDHEPSEPAAAPRDPFAPSEREAADEPFAGTEPIEAAEAPLAGAEPREPFAGAEPVEAADAPSEPPADEPIAASEPTDEPFARSEPAEAPEPPLAPSEPADEPFAPAAPASPPPPDEPVVAADEPVEAGDEREPFDIEAVDAPAEAPTQAHEWLEDDRDEVPADEALDHPRPAEPAEGEDVLEETPEFLQETPEHDRLWFEQRPPRDFDWDK